MLSFKVNPVYSSLSILLKLRKDVPEIEFSIQVLNEAEKFPVRFYHVLNKNGIRKFHVWSVGKEVNNFFYSPAE